MATKTKKEVALTRDVPGVCKDLRALQRRRAVVMKSRIMQTNRVRAVVAGTLGFHPGMKEKDRDRVMKEAADLVKAVLLDPDHPHPMRDVVRVTYAGVEAFNAHQAVLEREMVRLVRSLPAARFAEGVRGFGLQSLATVIGECGDLSNYPNPAKVWRRMGMAPWEFNGQTRMGCTWRCGKEGKLPADQWTAYGYSPRRRSIGYVIAECLLKGNDGSWRQRYEEVKARSKQTHPDWKDKRHDLHSRLVATKTLLRDLWVYWHQKAECPTRAKV